VAAKRFGPARQVFVFPLAQLTRKTWQVPKGKMSSLRGDRRGLGGSAKETRSPSAIDGKFPELDRGKKCEIYHQKAPQPGSRTGINI
jgi:hypothetical protein